MRKTNLVRFRVATLVATIIFSMGMTTVPASAIDLGAKGKYIISVTPSARAAIEAAVVKAGGKAQTPFAAFTKRKQYLPAIVEFC